MLPRQVRKFFRLDRRGRHAHAAEIDDEIAFHLAERIDVLVARGWSVDDAAAEATRRFGDPATVRPALFAAAQQRDRRLDVFEWIDTLRTDLRIAARQLRSAPTFAFGTIAAFALGIGANATMFNVVDRLLLRAPAQVAAPNEVYTIHALPREQISFPAFVNLREHLSGAASIAVQTRAWPLPIGRGEDAQMAQTVFVDGSYFRTLGVHAAAGRLLSDDDARLPDGQAVAVIGFRLWQRQFDGDPSVVGRELIISSERVRIIGVAPEGFNGVGTRPLDLWLPVTRYAGLFPGGGPQWAWGTDNNASWLVAIARVAPHGDSRQVATRATTLLRSAAIEHATRDTSTSVELRSILPSRAKTFSPEAKIAWLLGAVSTLVLLIACSNATNLMLARAVRRRREIGIRMALGVSRLRLVAGLLVDATLLSTLGGIAAIVVAIAGSALMRDVLLEGFVWSDGLVDGRTIAFIACTAALAGLVTGSVPALVLLRRFDLSRAIGEGRQSGGVHRHRVISSLVVTQTVLSAMLLIGALLFVRSLTNVRAVSLGVDMEHVVVVTLDSRTIRASASRADALFAELQTAVARAPGVVGVATAEGAPFSQWFLSTLIGVPGHSPDSPAIKRGAFIRAVTSSYFATIGTRIVQGRAFTNTEDRATGEQIVIVSAAMAKVLWPAGGAVGQCVRLGARPGVDSMPCRRIVGVAEETQESAVEPNGIDSPYAAIVYVPLSQGRHTIGARSVIARIDASPADVIGRVRRAIQRVEPDMPLANVWLMQSRHDPEVRPWRLGATMFGVFGILALILAALGLYSVIGYSVTQRTGEMGIRIALGAQRTHILSLVGTQGAVLAAIGIVIATGGSALLAPLIQPLLFQTSARSVPVYVLVGAGLLTVAIAASLIPAARAARVSPMSVIRSD
ncbi:MAG: ADOP family duplicated permease [bacterium]